MKSQGEVGFTKEQQRTIGIHGVKLGVQLTSGIFHEEDMQSPLLTQILVECGSGVGDGVLARWTEPRKRVGDQAARDLVAGVQLVLCVLQFGD